MSDNKDDKQPTMKEKEDTSKAGPSTAPADKPEKKRLPQLGALEDDDEFEVGPSVYSPISRLRSTR